MKKLLAFLLGLLLSAPAGYAQVQVGELVPPLHFTAVLNGPQPTLALAQLRGKVVLLEFWGTYCGPCVAAMPHLQELQRQFAEQLQVVAISEEAPARVSRYLQTRPSNLLFATVSSAASDSLQQLFSYHIVPHSVLLDAAGRVVANTDPKYLTAAVLTQVINHQYINLPVVKDDMVKNPIAAYFPASAATPPRFLLQPAMQGVPSQLRTYPQDTSVFHNRRLVALNVPLEMLYRVAYGNLPYGRTLDLRPAPPTKTAAPTYCLDIIVPKGQEATLLPRLRQELTARFELRATLEPRLKPVYLLTVADASKLPPASPAAGAGSASASRGEYQGQRVRLADVADYLENFGIEKLPVLDATQSAARYDIDLDYEPAKPGDLQRALAAVGLALEKAERPVEMLVLR